MRTIEVTAQGQYRYNGKISSVDDIEQDLVRTFQANPHLVVYIRADENGPYKYVASVLDRCERNGITRISLRTEPVRRP